MSKQELVINNLKTGIEDHTLVLVNVAIESLQELKGQDIVVLDLKSIDEASANYFVICNGTSSTHISGLGDRVEKNLKKQLDEYPNHVEGRHKTHWLLLDYFNVVIHIFDKEKRNFYDLEGLWSDAKITQYKDI